MLEIRIYLLPYILRFLSSFQENPWNGGGKFAFGSVVLFQYVTRHGKVCHCAVGSFYHKVSQAPALISQGKCSECFLLHPSCVELYLKENSSSAMFLFVVIGVFGMCLDALWVF